MTSSTETLTFTVNILPDISKSKYNQPRKLGHLKFFIKSHAMQKMRLRD